MIYTDIYTSVHNASKGLSHAARHICRCHRKPADVIDPFTSDT